jgi:hypothetical protein
VLVVAVHGLCVGRGGQWARKQTKSVTNQFSADGKIPQPLQNPQQAKTLMTSVCKHIQTDILSHTVPLTLQRSMKFVNTVFLVPSRATCVQCVRREGVGVRHSKPSVSECCNMRSTVHTPSDLLLACTLCVPFTDRLARTKQADACLC